MSKDMNKLIVVAVATAVIVGGAAFGGGYAVAKKSAPALAGRGMMARDGQAGGQQKAQRAASNMANGEVLTVEEGSLTIKLADGGSRIVLLGKDAVVSYCAEAELSTVQPGTSLLATGEANADGSLTARFIQAGSVMQQFRMGRPEGAVPGQPSTDKTTSQPAGQDRGGMPPDGFEPPPMP
jgi:hypothetical protein